MRDMETFHPNMNNPYSYTQHCHPQSSQMTQPAPARPVGLLRRQSFEPLSHSSASKLSLGSLPPPLFSQFERGQRSVPAFEGSTFQLFGSSSSTNGFRSISGPLTDSGQRTPGGSLAIGAEVFGWGSSRSSSHKEPTLLSGSDFDASDLVERAATPTRDLGGWPVEFEPGRSSPKVMSVVDRKITIMSTSNTSGIHRPSIKQSGSSLDLRSSVFSSSASNTQDGAAFTPSSTQPPAPSRPSIPRSKSGLPGYEMSRDQRASSPSRSSFMAPLPASMANSSSFNVAPEPTLTDNGTRHDQRDGVRNLSSSTFGTDGTGANNRDSSLHLAHSQTREQPAYSREKNYPAGENDWLNTSSTGSASNNGHQDRPHTTDAPSVPVYTAFDPYNGAARNLAPTQQQMNISNNLGPDTLAFSFQHMSINPSGTSPPLLNPQGYGPSPSSGSDVQRSRGSSGSAGAGRPDGTITPAPQATPYGNYYATVPHLTDMYYGAADPAFFASRGTEANVIRRDNEGLPVPWGMPTMSDYSGSSNGGTSTRHGSFSTPYSPSMSPQPPHIAYGTAAGAFNVPMGYESHFQPAQQHQIILGRQMRSNADYIAPGPKSAPGATAVINPSGIVGYNGTRPFGVGYGPGYGAGETMGRALRSQLLDEFRNARHRHWELANIMGHIVEFAGDQLGSRFIQTKLETAGPDEKNMVFQEILPNLLQLSTDVFANYVVQKFFEQGSQLQKTAMANVLEGHILELSLQMYGCRVVQKAIEFLLLDQQIRLVKELDGHILKCARDAQSNHVIQRAIERIPSDKIVFITDACLGNVHMLATHPYGCRVLQRIFENCPPSQARPLLEELHACAQHLIQDQYGNYVVQWVIERGDPKDRSLIISLLYGQVFHFAQQKFASNVVEKCILNGTDEERQRLIGEILQEQSDGSSTIRAMLVHPYANYVVQKTLLRATGAQRDRILDETTQQLANLRNYPGQTFSKHLVTIEKLLQNERSRA